MRELTGQPEPAAAAAAAPAGARLLPGWIARDPDPREQPDSVPGVMWHLDDTWARRSDPNVVLVHYDDLCADLAGEMRGLAALLGIAVPERAWPALAEAATLRSMRAGAEAGTGCTGRRAC
jgi:aryl sulfotransferase